MKNVHPKSTTNAMFRLPLSSQAGAQSTENNN